MRKFYIIGLFLLCSISLMSQTMETGTITSDSIATKPHKKNFFGNSEDVNYILKWSDSSIFSKENLENCGTIIFSNN